jgi:GABA permease
VVSNETTELAQERPTGGLGTSLKPRHITMISIAGVIGAGLFVGSKNAIKEAGPAVLISYFLAGTLVVLVMRMLGEMATANPDTGSFSCTPTGLSARGRASRSAGSTGGSGCW